MNNVKAYRLKAGLTRAALAKRTGSSYGQILRAESGHFSTPLPLALRICTALRASPEELYPGSGELVTALQAMDSMEFDCEVRDGGGTAQQFRTVGLDADPNLYILSVGLSSGAEFLFAVSSETRENLLHALPAPLSNPFVIFDSEGHTVALNTEHVDCLQLLNEAAYAEGAAAHLKGCVGLHEPAEACSMVIEVHFAGRSKPEGFSVNPDPFQMRHTGSSESAAAERPVHALVAALDEFDPGGLRFLSFEDNDGEEVLLRPESVAMLMVPDYVLGRVEYDDDDFVAPARKTARTRESGEKTRSRKGSARTVKRVR